MTDHLEFDEDIETLLRRVTAVDAELLEPPADLWAQIDAGVRAEVVSPGSANVVELDRRRRISTRPMLLAAAAAALLFVGGITIYSQRSTNPETVVAAAQLQYDPANFDELGATAAAHVSLVDDGGQFSVEIDESALPSPTGEDADLELWLIEPDAEGNPVELLSLGLIDPNAPGTYAVPADYDPGVYFVVDISIEPRDGVPTHSGRSILRGALTDV